MTTSIREFKKELLEEFVPLSVLLRKAVLIAREVKDTDNEAWMQAELKGYKDDKDVPDYRVLGGQPMLHNHMVGWEVMLFKIADPQIVKLLTSMEITGPISEVEEYAKQPHILLHYGNNFEEFIQERLNKIGKPGLALAGSQFKTILETVRNMLFDWVSRLPDTEESSSIQETPEIVMPTEKTWSKSVEDHPLRYALLIVIATAAIVAGVMGWIQNERVENLTTRYETEKLGIKNEYEAQIRELKTRIDELQKQVPQPAKRR